VNPERQEAQDQTIMLIVPKMLYITPFRILFQSKIKTVKYINCQVL